MYEITFDSNVYSSVPDDVLPTTTVEERQPVHRALEARTDHRPVTAKTLALLLGYEHKHTAVKVRKIITELLEFDKVPVVAVGRGFRLARTEQDVRDYEASLRCRLLGLERRIRSVHKILESGIMQRQKPLHPNELLKHEELGRFNVQEDNEHEV